MKILNYGSMNIDNVYQVSHILTPGETLLASGLARFCGGKGLNQAIALRKAGSDVYMAGVAGADGDMLVEALQRHGVDTHLVKRVEGASGHTVIQVDEQAQNSIIVHADPALITFTDEEMDVILSEFGPGDALIEQNELARSPRMMQKASEKGMTILFNPSPLNDAIWQFPLDRVDWFVLNEVEGHALTGKTEPEEILDQMQERFPRASVVLTLGDKGAYCMSSGRRICQPAYPVEAVDTTAAGDTFTGYFITGMMRGEPLESVLQRAAYAASICVSRKGAADSIPSAEEMQ